MQAMQDRQQGLSLVRGTTVGSSFSGTPRDIFEHLPQELRITVDDGDEPHTYTGHDPTVRPWQPVERVSSSSSP